jgi:hypothetical protein
MPCIAHAITRGRGSREPKLHNFTDGRCLMRWDKTSVRNGIFVMGTQ